MTLAALVAACLLTASGRVYVQVRTGGLPAGWPVVELAIAGLPVAAAWTGSPWLAGASLVLGAVVLVVGVVHARRLEAGPLADAEIGQRERVARRSLRRVTPPEQTRRALTPITVSPELHAEGERRAEVASTAMRSIGGR